MEMKPFLDILFQRIISLVHFSPQDGVLALSGGKNLLSFQSTLAATKTIEQELSMINLLPSMSERHR